MYSCLKKALLYLSKWLGLFHLTRYVTQKGLRILCYHGFALKDEAHFRPGLFMEAPTFEKRMEFLTQKEFPVLQLEKALKSLQQGELPPCATVITVDDGFYGTDSRALEIFQKFFLPATVYVTTYYAIKEHPIFRLVVQYMFWKTDQQQLNLAELGMVPGGQVTFEDNQKKEEILWRIICYGETQCDEVRRCEIARTLGKYLNVDYRDIEQSRMFSLMNRIEIQTMVQAGIDIQLHTHRHRLPSNKNLTIQEIADNRAVLEPLVGHPLSHLCYPSGIWSEEHWPWLEAVGIQSATTCEPGLNYSNTPQLALLRFLDREDISQIEFEAEMAGYSELLRRVKSFFSRWLK